jgi:predicted DCC family thiol-disulfide oxidoreductase YuxK
MSEAHHLIFFDEDCAFCSRSTLWILRHDRSDAFRFAPLSGPLADRLLPAGERGPGAESLAVLPNFDAKEAPGREREPGGILERSDAVLFIAVKVGWPWKAAAALRLAPRRLRDRGYDFLARRRHALGRRPDSCFAPPAVFRSKFLEVP